MYKTTPDQITSSAPSQGPSSPSPQGAAFGRMQPLVALRALRTLINDPQRTDQVFEVIRAMSGPSLVQGLARFEKTEVGKKVLGEQRDLLTALLNREWLAAQAPGSLAEAYYQFTAVEELTADGLVEASLDEGAPLDMPEDLAIYAARLRDQHDLWHTLTRYGRDELGEVCLLAFTYAQTRNRGIGMICLAGTFKLSKLLGKQVFAAVRQAYRDGRRAEWLPAQDWEHLLTLPVDEVRARLGLAQPVAYQTLFAATRTAVAA